MGKNRENAILLDVGCGFGNDARRAIYDGFPLRNVICSDLRKEFFDLGHKLYKTTPETFPLAFFEGDIFQTEFATNADSESTPNLNIVSPRVDGPIPDLHMLKNLGELKGKISVINASAFFHLFDHEKQRELAHLMNELLSPQPGSMMLGGQGGAITAQVLPSHISKVVGLHSPETWKELLTGSGGPFKPSDVEFRACLEPFSLERLGITAPTTQTGDSNTGQGYWLLWSVKRL